MTYMAMTPTDWLIIGGAIAGIVLLILFFIIRINHDYETYIRTTQHLPCESCSDTTCVCDMGFVHGKGKGKGSGRSEQVPGEGTEETDRKTLNV